MIKAALRAALRVLAALRTAARRPLAPKRFRPDMNIEIGRANVIVIRRRRIVPHGPFDEANATVALLRSVYL